MEELYEFYDHAFSANPSEVTHSAVTDRDTIDTIVAAFIGTKTTPLDVTADDMAGFPASGVRFTLADGHSVEITSVDLGPYHVVAFWPDGEVRATRSALPSGYFYGDDSTASLVDPSERPAVTMP